MTVTIKLLIPTEKKKNDFLLYGGWEGDGLEDHELEAWKYTVNWY